MFTVAGAGFIICVIVGVADYGAVNCASGVGVCVGIAAGDEATNCVADVEDVIQAVDAFAPPVG